MVSISSMAAESRAAGVIEVFQFESGGARLLQISSRIFSAK
jgi:hypothetical protein